MESDEEIPTAPGYCQSKMLREVSIFNIRICLLIELATKGNWILGDTFLVNVSWNLRVMVDEKKVFPVVNTQTGNVTIHGLKSS